VLMDETALLFERLEQSLRRVRRAAAGQEGELRLGYIGPPVQAFLGRLLEEYARRCPQVTVHLEERTPERVWEMVAKGRLDLGLTRPVLAHAALRMETQTIRRERLCAAVPAGHEWHRRRSLPWRSLAGQPLIILARREGAGLHDEILAGCRSAKFTPRMVHTPSLISTVLRYVEAGMGIGVVPESIGECEGGRTWSSIPLTPSETVPLVLVWKDDHAEPPVDAFRKLLDEWMRAGKLFPAPVKNQVLSVRVSV
jgi:DNA-binding transcriptional LysR family regulator